MDTCAAEIFEMPEGLQHFFINVKPEDEESLAGNENSVFWLLKAYHGADEEDKVNEILNKLRTFYIRAENYWASQVQGAGQKLDDATKVLSSEGDSEDVHVILVANDADLQKVQDALDDDLKLTRNLPIGDSKIVPAGQSLLNLGRVKEMLQGKDVRKRLLELRRGMKAGQEIRLLFSADTFGARLQEATDALTDLAVLVKAVKKPALAFPEKVGEEFERLKENHRTGELKVKDIEAKRVRQVQEKELDEAMQVADKRLASVESARVKLQAQYNQLMKEKQVLEADKVNLMKQKTSLEHEKQELIGVRDKLYGIRDKLIAEKKEIQDQKTSLDNDFAQLQDEKNALTAKKKEQEQALVKINQFLKDDTQIQATPGVTAMQQLVNRVTGAS